MTNAITRAFADEVRAELARQDVSQKAAAAAVSRASASLRDLRIAEVAELDLQIEGGQVTAYRAKVKVSFKYEGGD